MAWMRCRSCSALFAIGLLRCPQCGAISELYARPDWEDEETMPKITIAGASNALESREPAAVAAAAQASAVEPAPVHGPESEPTPEPKAAPDAGVETDAKQVAAVAEAENAPAAPPKKRAAKKAAEPPQS